MGVELAHVDDVFSAGVIEPMMGLATQIAKTEFVPKEFRNRPEAILAAFLTGRELGIAPMQALSKIHVIEGKPTISAELMRALVQRQGHEIWFESNNTKVTVFGKRKGTDHVSQVTWTMDDAKRARLDGKDVWKRYPRAMMLARATGELCRAIFADVLSGVSYTKEEVEDGVIDAEVVGEGEPAAIEPPKTTRKAAPPRKAAAPRKDAAPLQPAAERPLPPLPGEEDEDPAAASGAAGPPPPAAESDDVVTKRAQQIAMKAREAGLDHHHVVSAVTSGVTESAKEITAEEGAEVLQAIHDIANGRKDLSLEDDGRWALVDAESSDDEEPEAVKPEVLSQEDSAERWDSDQWRSFLSGKGVKVTELVKEAQRFAADAGTPAPGNLEALAGQRELAAHLVNFACDLAVQRGPA